MSYTVTITGDAPDVPTEDALVTDFENFLDGLTLPTGATVAAATFVGADGTSIDLLPPPVSPQTELDDAIKNVDELLAALAQPAGGSVTITADQAAQILTGYAELQAAAAAYEAAVGNGSASSTSSAPSSTTSSTGSAPSSSTGATTDLSESDRAALNAEVPNVAV
jgi:hypothetical protein